MRKLTLTLESYTDLDIALRLKTISNYIMDGTTSFSEIFEKWDITGYEEQPDDIYKPLRDEAIRLSQHND